MLNIFRTTPHLTSKDKFNVIKVNCSLNWDISEISISVSYEFHLTKYSVNQLTSLKSVFLLPLWNNVFCGLVTLMKV